MMEKEMKKLSRAELLELLLMQTRDTERLQKRLDRMEEELTQRQLNAHRMPSVLRKRPVKDYRDVARAASEGDRLAKEIMRQFYDYTGQLLAGICCVTNPDTIVLGGDFCEFGRDAIDNISHYFHKYIFHANETVNFKMAKLDRDACIYGAFKLVLDNMQGEQV